MKNKDIKIQSMMLAIVGLWLVAIFLVILNIANHFKIDELRQTTERLGQFDKAVATHLGVYAQWQGEETVPGHYCFYDGAKYYVNNLNARTTKGE